METRLKTKAPVPPELLENVHWKAIERAYNRLTLLERLPIFKLIHNKWPTNMTIASWDAEKDPICDRCGTQEETALHIFQCRSKHAQEKHKNGIKVLEETLRKINTAPVAIRTIISLVQSARKGYFNLNFNNILDDDDTKQLATKICEKQQNFSPFAFLQGYISSDWIILQICCTDLKMYKLPNLPESYWDNLILM